MLKFRKVYICNSCGDVELPLVKYTLAVLEGILCPLQRHAWEYDHLNECYICKRCGKVRLGDYEEG